MVKKKSLLLLFLIIITSFVLAATPNAWTLDNFWTLIGSDIYYDEGDVHIGGDLWLDGDIFRIEGQIVNGSWIPQLNNTFTVGNSTNLWSEGWFNKMYVPELLQVGADTLYVTAGKVGIGTGSPGAALQVKGATNKEIQIGTTAGVYTTVLEFTDLSTLGVVINLARPSDGAFHNSIFSYDTAVAAKSNLGIHARTDLVLATAGAEEMRILANGNVGIGTTSPYKLLHLLGSSNVSSIIQSNTDTDNTYAKLLFKTSALSVVDADQAYAKGAIIFEKTTDYGRGSLHLAVDGGADTSDAGVEDARLTILDGGNVGIGTTSPTHKLNVAGNANITGNLTSENVFIPQYEFAHTNATISLDTVNVWKNISFEQEDSDVSFGISHTYDDSSNHTFMIMEDGVYEINYDFDMEDTSIGASNTDVAGRLIYSNGTEVIGSDFETDITKQSAETELSHDFLARFQAGDIVVFQFVGDDVDVQISTHGTFGDHPESASIVMKKIANL